MSWLDQNIGLGSYAKQKSSQDHPAQQSREVYRCLSRAQITQITSPVTRTNTDQAQAGIKITRRNINNLGYSDDTTLMAESEEEQKSLLMKVKEESEKAGFTLKLQKMKIMASGPITSWQIGGETMETVRNFIFLGSKITWTIKKAREFQKNINFCFIDYAKAFDSVDYNKV